MRPFIQLDSAERRNQPFPIEVTVLALARPAWWIWFALAALSLLAALAWRWTGNAPPIPFVLDGAGLVLWLSGYWLANHWNRLLVRQHRHIRQGPEWWSWRLINAGHLLIVAVLLALAPLSLLLAYDTNATVAQIYISDPPNLHLPAGLWLAHSLVLLGPSLVLVSVFLLHTLRRACGWHWGFALWLAATCIVHASVTLGQTMIAFHTALGTFAASLGGFAAWAAQRTAQTRIETPDLITLYGSQLKLPMLILPAAIVLIVLAQWQLNHRQPSVNPAWLAATLAVLATAGRALWQAWLWVRDAGLASPGDWRVLMVLGIATIWIVWGLLILDKDRRLTVTALGPVGWCGLAAAAWTTLTLTHRIATNVEPASLLAGGALSAILAALGVLLISRLGWLYRDLGLPWAGGLVVFFPAVLLLPLGGGLANQPLLSLLFSALQRGLRACAPGQQLLALLACAAVLIALARLTARHGRRIPAAASQE
ncbi:hypothetical protein JW859_13610 [bacterium]|nr:hypothetical protein [bacterium]